MARRRHTPEQIITALREAEVGLATGNTVALDDTLKIEPVGLSELAGRMKLGVSSVSAVINNDLPALNYDFDVCQIKNVGDRIAINDYDVGKFAWLQGADLVTEVQVGCRVVG